MVITTLRAKHCHKTLCGKRKKKGSGSTLIHYRFPAKIPDLIVLISALPLNAKGPTKKHHILSHFTAGSGQSQSPTASCPAPLRGTPGAQPYVLRMGCKSASPRGPTAPNPRSWSSRKPAVFSSLRASLHQRLR